MRVLVVEDEVLLADAIREGLERAAMAVDVVHDGDLALESLSVNDYDAVVLDRDIPGTHGDDVCATLARNGSTVRVLMLTAARRTDQKVTGFELGADDYLAKPFEFTELIARLRALGRRSGDAKPPVLERSGVRLDVFKHTVTRDGLPIHLSRKEFAVLEILLGADGGVVSAEQLLEKAWDENADPFTNSIRVVISTLRKRLGSPWVIETIPGVGYRVVGD
ncbi:response regulator transcription factor [Plantibacter sp. Mn2098]|uniref:response regulator transcription factor n=1 Tax=Plantibacter sp. Mn2098 TaxID=3395266 RepID=UPI003BE86A2B